MLRNPLGGTGSGGVWRAELGWVLATAIFALVGELAFGAGLLFLAIGLLVNLARHFCELGRLILYLRDGKAPFPEGASGLWADVFTRVRRLRGRSRKRKRKLSTYVRRFREATSALPDAAVILGRRGEVEWCNPAAETLLGMSWPRVAGMLLTQLVHHPVLHEYLRRGDYARPLELPSPVDKAKILAFHVTPFGKKRQRLLVGRDITRAYHLDRVQRDFVANASHELRTPLTVVVGMLETVQAMDAVPQRLQRALELMQEQADRMQRIVHDLLALSRLEMAGSAAESEPCPMPEILRRIVDEARSFSGEGGHQIELIARDDLWLRGDQEELRSIASNLVFNAVRHTPPRTAVDVHWHADELGAYLVVRDTGEGISARHIPRLTERFYRVDKGRSRERGGTGLGLSIVKYSIEHHGGELTITSEVGRGSVFTCRFPKSRLTIRAEQAANVV